MITKNNFYILTGGPGVGKTTLINELQRRKINSVPEVAREIIKDHLIEVLCLPVSERADFILKHVRF